MTKAQEIEHLRKFTNECPPGYLRDMLRYLLPQFERDIISDFITFPDILKLEEERRAVQKQIHDLQHQLHAQQASIRQLDEQAQARRAQITEARKEAEYFGQRLLTASQRI